MSKQLVKSNSFLFWRRSTSELLLKNSHAVANNFVKSAIYWQSTTSKKKTCNQHLTYSRNQKNSVKTTSLAKQWRSITWRVTIEESERCDQRSITCNRRFPSRQGSNDQKYKPIHIWISVLCSVSLTNTNLLWIMQCQQSSFYKRWCFLRS